MEKSFFSKLCQFRIDPGMTFKKEECYIIVTDLLVCYVHGRSQDFSKGGSHWLIQRVLIRLSPEYCRLFAYKKAYKGGVTGTPGPPLATPLIRKSLFQFYFIICLVSSSTWIATKFGADVLYMNQKMFFLLEIGIILFTWLVHTSDKRLRSN